MYKVLLINVVIRMILNYRVKTLFYNNICNIYNYKTYIIDDYLY
jgi:hypothetical protein